MNITYDPSYEEHKGIRSYGANAIARNRYYVFCSECMSSVTVYARSFTEAEELFPGATYIKRDPIMGGHSWLSTTSKHWGTSIYRSMTAPYFVNSAYCGGLIEVVKYDQIRVCDCCIENMIETGEMKWWT